jgi:outer membrane protein assembly factor BamB
VFSIASFGKQQRLLLTPLRWNEPGRPLGGKGDVAPPPVALPLPLPAFREVVLDSLGGPRIFHDAIYVVTGDSEVRKFDNQLNHRWPPNSQKVPKEERLENAWTFRSILHVDDFGVYVQGWTGKHDAKRERIYKLDVNVGSVVGQIEYERNRDSLPWLFDSQHDRFYLIGGGRARCVRLSDGKGLWEVAARGSFRTRFELPIPANGGLLVADPEKIIWYDGDGREDWSLPVHPGMSRMVAASDDGVVYVMYNDPVLTESRRWLAALDLASGRTIWRTQTPPIHYEVDRIHTSGSSLYLYPSESRTGGWLYRYHRGTGVLCWKATLPGGGDHLYPAELVVPGGGWGYFRAPTQDPNSGERRVLLYGLVGL